MTVASEITRIYGVRSNIFDAITAKGVTVPEGSKLGDCPTLIGQITGGDTPVPEMPAMTLRLLFADGVTPIFEKGTATQVSSSPNIWDLYYNNSSWYSLLTGQRTLLKVIAVGDTSSVTNTGYMFRYCSALREIPLFDTSNVKSTSAMFNGCSALASVPLLDTSSVTNMSEMFHGCSALVSVPLFNTNKVKDMSYMFSGCSSLTGIPLFSTAAVTTMSYMFNQCTALTSVPLLDTNKVTNMSFMFQACSSLTSVPLFNTSAVTNMSTMLRQCSITRIPLFDTSKVTNMTQFAYLCTKVEQGALALYQQASTQTTPPTSHSFAFAQCGRDTVSGAAELAQIPSSWGGTAA